MPTATSQPQQAGYEQPSIIVSDSTGDAWAQEQAFLSAGAATPIQGQTKVLATNPPGVWTYENSKIQVRIERHNQGSFVYFAADIQLTSPHQLSYAFANEKFGGNTEALSDIAQRHNPLIAVNGDYCGFHNNGIIIRGGEIYREKYTERQMLIVDANGDLSIFADRTDDATTDAAALKARGVLHTFEFGPLMVNHGQAVEMESAIMPVAEGYLEPRTAIGQLGPLHYLVIVVDGRSEGYSDGCDLPTLQQLFIKHGADFAFNLDGGGSTTLWFDGSVINQPSSGDERKVSDIVMFMPD